MKLTFLSRYVNSTADTLYPSQPPSAVLGIRILTAGIPVLASPVVIWALSRYPLHGPALAETRRKMECLRRAEVVSAPAS